MSLFHYIGANKELPLGKRGSKKIDDGHESESKRLAIRIKNTNLPKGMIPLEQIIDLSHIKPDNIEEYETMEDAAGIYIEEVPQCYSSIKNHFKSKYVYQVSASFGNFLLNKSLKERYSESYSANKKCLKELFKLIEENINEDENMEIYSCWADEEDEPRNRKLDMSINLVSFEIGDNFELKDKQYIVVNKCNLKNNV
jgi:hypothetical protein